MFVKEEYDNLLKEIAESGGDTPKMLELMQKLRDDFDEREGELKRYREAADKETPEGEKAEEEKIVEDSERDNRSDGGERRDAYDELSRRYDDLHKKYIERFFSTPDEAKEDQRKDVKRDGKEQSFDELFKEREG